MKIYKVTDPEFRKYGRVVKNVDFTDLVARLKKTPLTRDVAYEPSVSGAGSCQRCLQSTAALLTENCRFRSVTATAQNYLLNALEYHRSSEINVAGTDAILLVGSQQDITEDFTYDTSRVEAFLLPKGTAVEVYATTLHYAPCQCR